MTKKLIVVAERAGAKLFEVTGIQSAPVLLESLDNPTGRMKNQELEPGHLTQVDYPAHGATSVVTAKKSPAEIEVDKFIKKLSDKIEVMATGNAFNAITIVAEPSTLGKLKQSLGSHSAKKLTDTIQKDIARLPEAQIKEHLTGLV